MARLHIVCRILCIGFTLISLSILPCSLMSPIAFAKATISEDAGPDLDEWCESNDCTQFFSEIINGELASRLRLFEQQAVERFDIHNQAETCRLNRPLQPTYFALLIGPGYEGSLKPLKGPANDVAYLSQVLKERGVDSERVKILTGTAVDRDQIIRSMRGILACLQAGDQVFFAFSGHGTRVPQLATRSIDIVVQDACQKTLGLSATGLCQKDAIATENWGLLKQLYEAESLLWAKSSDNAFDGTFLIMLTSGDFDYEEWKSGRRPVPGLLAMEIANFATQIRNVDADAFILIDTAYAAAARLTAQAKQRSWFSETDGDPIELNGYDVPLTGRGQIGAFYAAKPWSEAIERPMSPLGRVGVFSYLFSESLRKLTSPTVAELAKEIQTQYDLQSKRTPPPVINASNPNLVFMPALTKTEPNEKDIEIIQPTIKRSAEVLESAVGPTLNLVARYTGKERPYKAIIDGEVVDIDQNGQFRKIVDEASSKTSVDIRVLSRDFATLAHRILRLKLSDQDIILKSTGRKLALFIANQDYEDEKFNDLQTPKADAEAIRKILSDTFGFSSVIDREDGSKLDLFLVNATRGSISRALFELRKRLTKEDDLIVYYAGHGDNVEGAGSYWVPVDGRYDEYFDWIDANDITTELRLMNARSILLISDSCYSGGLVRGEDAVAKVTSEARERYLAKARSFKARQLIASGGEEPVEDGGGGVHSIFAKALIDGLATMPGSAFTASELLEQKVKPAVVNMPTALSERQIPGFHRIAKAGDEIGSEFIFVRTGQSATP
jgi:uncharacterized caspase-like protein